MNGQEFLWYIIKGFLIELVLIIVAGPLIAAALLSLLAYAAQQ